jgi:two-component system, NtrC family, response regulator HydG
MNRRALVVDDDRVMVRTLSDVLRLNGWSVTPAFDGREAVAAANDGAFDVVLMDVKMPGIDGVQAFKEMKRAHPKVRVILMTAYASHEIIAEAEREGVLQVMPKPVNIPLLLAVLAQTLNRQQPVLVVDHDATFLRTLSDVLRLHGFEAVVATSIDTARHELSRKKPVAVLLHMHLGAATPHDAVVAVHETNPEVAVILYSGEQGAADEARNTLPHGWVHAYIQKPLDIDQLTGMLDAISTD